MCVCVCVLVRCVNDTETRRFREVGGGTGALKTCQTINSWQLDCHHLTLIQRNEKTAEIKYNECMGNTAWSTNEITSPDYVSDTFISLFGCEEGLGGC